MQPALPAILDHKVLKGTRVTQDLSVRRELPVIPDLRVFRVILGLSVQLVIQDRRDLKVIRETQDLRASRVIRVIQGLLAQLAQPVILGHKDHRVTREIQVL